VCLVKLSWSTTQAPIAQPIALVKPARAVAPLHVGTDARAQRGVRALLPECDIVVFLDGDGSDIPAFMNQLVDQSRAACTIS
jgi:hypothetical protein